MAECPAGLMVLCVKVSVEYKPTDLLKTFSCNVIPALRDYTAYAPDYPINVLCFSSASLTALFFNVISKSDSIFEIKSTNRCNVNILIIH